LLLQLQLYRHHPRLFLLELRKRHADFVTKDDDGDHLQVTVSATIGIKIDDVELS
jgi:hypothetical protein